jgi:hypothetical protein
MPQYMLLLRDDTSAYKNFTPGDWQSLIEKYNAWSQKVASQGLLVDGKKLTDEGGRVLAMRDGKLTVKDGPFGETKEVMGGYFTLKARDYDHAVELCRDHPQFATNGQIEIRQVDFMGQPEE